ncbi:MAG: nucleotidyltransferase domain-containing protein [Nitrospiraceae bacterium]
MTFPSVRPTLLALLNERDRSAPPPSLDRSAWDQLARDAENHGLAPWLYRWSCDHPSAVPAQVRDRLKTNVAAVAGRTLILADELATILRALHRRNISCPPLRGLTLAEYLPGTPSVRPMGDLDLLVKREDCSRVRDVLQRLGYTEVDRRPGFAETYSYTLEFVKDRHGWITVEPHWTIAYPPFMDAINMDAVWNRCRRGTVAGVETRLLSQEDLLLNLCWHLHHKGADAPLLWWHELDLLLRHHASAIDWPRLVSTIGCGAHAGLLTEVLATLVREFRSPIPAQVITKLSKSASIPTHHSARLFTGPLAVDGVESLAQFFAIKGLRAKTRYVWTLLVPSREFMIRHYGVETPGQLYLRYGMRGLALAWGALKGLLNILLPARRLANR